MPSHVIPATHFDLLEKSLLAHVATIGPHGEPQTNPIWYIWDNDRFWMSIGPTGQKAKNLERDPRIAVSMADPENPIHYLELRGIAVDRKTVGSTDPMVLALVRKYTGQDSYDGMPDDHTLIAIDVTRTTSSG